MHVQPGTIIAVPTARAKTGKDPPPEGGRQRLRCRCGAEREKLVVPLQSNLGPGGESQHSLRPLRVAIAQPHGRIPTARG